MAALLYFAVIAGVLLGIGAVVLLGALLEDWWRDES